jgi:hypothetical protein
LNVKKTISRYRLFKLNILLSCEFDFIHPNLRQTGVKNEQNYVHFARFKLHSINAAKGRMLLFVTVLYSYTSIYTKTTQEFVILSPDLKKNVKGFVLLENL